MVSLLQSDWVSKKGSEWEKGGTFQQGGGRGSVQVSNSTRRSLVWVIVDGEPKKMSDMRASTSAGAVAVRVPAVLKRLHLHLLESGRVLPFFS